ncbi:putative diguanylate cyclase DgcC [Companilactobacillus paralimentarius]
MWYFVALKFSLTMSVFLQEWGYLVIFEVLLYSYVRMLLRESELKGHLEAFANHDALTKSENYAAYSSEIKYLFANSLRNNLGLSMMMFDIDHFKHVNDTYGHLAGDKVLQKAVSTTQTVIDDNDPKVKLYRTGGEEFNVVFPGYDLPATEPIVSQIFNALNHLTVRNKDQEISFTVSMGVSGISSTDKTPDDFYNRVDDNLYHSKKNGRMQITAI